MLYSPTGQVFVDDLDTDVDYSDMWLPMLTMYAHPADFPHHVVIRVWEGRSGQPTNVYKLCGSIAEARAAVPARFTCLPRQPSDDPAIVESYV